MRGRTNASNGGIFLNATTDNFEVATGNSIVAGDFVEYHYDSVLKPLNSTFVGDSYLVDATTHTYIGLIGGYATLFTYIDGEITIVSTYATASTCLVMLDATHYFVWNDTTRKVGLVSCTTSTITLVDEEYSASSSANSFVRVNATTMVYKHNNSNNLYKVYTDANYTSIAGLTSTNIGSSFYIAGATSDSVVICQISGSSSAYTHTFRIYDISTLNQSGYFEMVSYDYTLSFYPNIVIEDRYLIVSYAHKTIQSGVTKNYPYIYILDVIDKASKANIGFNDLSVLSCSLSSVSSQNGFIVYELDNTIPSHRLTYLYWVKFDSSLYTLTKSDYTIIENYVGNAIFAFNDTKFGFMINNQGYINLDTSTDKVVVGTPSNKVKEWEGSDDPLGVAKQSGNAGDTIAVYIPQVNS